jgi:putative tryptophan/tyrosine transport system substrate-binding protein
MPMKGLVPVKIDTFMATNRKTTFALVSQYQLPAIFGFRFSASEGGLMPYGPDFVEMHRRSASYVDRLLKEESPANLAIQQPTKYEFVINMKRATARPNGSESGFPRRAGGASLMH